MSERVEKTDDEWRELLGPERFRILREKGTERAFTGQYNDVTDEGLFVCGACGEELFDSSAKYDSGSGWPSFYAPIDEENIEMEEDTSLGMRRTEIVCARCGSHLGHVFPDGPQPSGMRYCVNSASLDFKPQA